MLLVRDHDVCTILDFFQLAGVWNKIQPLVDGLLQPEVRNGSATVSPSPRNISPLPAHLLSNST